MTSPGTERAPAPERFAVHAWSMPLRGLALAAWPLALGCLLFFSAWLSLDLFTGEPPRDVGLRFLGLGGPLVLAALLRWSTRATVEVETTQLVLTLRSGARMELPYDAMASMRHWKLPLPGPGLSVRMKSGRTFAYGLETDNAGPLLAAIDGHAPLGANPAHPLARYAQARHALWRRRWYHLAGKLLVFPLLPTAIIFQLKQRITYGGPFGEYQYFGLEAYLRAFVREYTQVLPLCVLVACLLRVLVEAVCLAATWLLPSRARGVRLGAEWLCRLAYYVGLLAVLAAFLLRD